MGREIRRVPPNWEHPRWQENENIPANKKVGEYKSMFNETFKDACQRWKKEFLEWESGNRPEWMSERSKEEECEFWEYAGHPPDRDYYRPEFTEEPTWFQVYQTVSEGYPVSPPFATEEELINYLVENGDFWDQERTKRFDNRDGFRFSFETRPVKPTLEEATAFVKGGWAPSGVIVTTQDGAEFKSGISALSQLKGEQSGAEEKRN